MAIAIDQARYILLGTRKKDGRMVDTPVWFSGKEGEYYLFSAGSAGKVKRLKNFSTAEMTPCTVSGKILGETVAANAELLTNPQQIHRAQQSLRVKYGWQMRGLDLLSRLSGKYQQRVFIRIVLLRE